MKIPLLDAVFPVTLEILAECHLLHWIDQFSRTLQQELALDIHTSSVLDVTRFFPVFLKIRGAEQMILEVAEFEFLKKAVEISEPANFRFQNSEFLLNPSIQFVELHHAQPKLGRNSGLYCFFKKGGELRELRLEMKQALIIDLLQGDFRELSAQFSKRYIAELAHDHSLGRALAVPEWERLIDELVVLGVLRASEAHPKFADAPKGVFP